MFRIVVLGCCIWALAGCAGRGWDAWWRPFSGAPAALGQYRFDWQLSGDPGLAPLQVFDDGHQTWLQYPPDAPVPALFERTAHGDRLLRPARDHDYLIVPGVPDHLVMRGGLNSAYAERVADRPAAEVSVSAEAPAAAEPAPSLPAPTVAAASAAAPLVPATSAAPAVRPAAQPMVVAAPAPAPEPALLGVVRPPGVPALKASVPMRHRPAAAPLESVSTRPYEVSPKDDNVRLALKRWARHGGWIFEDEHWAVDVDIPLAGAAQFPQPFKEAVRALLAATELGDRPLQPCFYANQVLRVVPLAQRCDRTAAPGEPS